MTRSHRDLFVSSGTALASTAVVLAAIAAVGAQGPRFEPGGPPPGMTERKVVKQFDIDGNGRLSTSERQEAQAWLATQDASQPPAFGRAGRGGRGARGFGPPPGFGPGGPGGGGARQTGSPGPRLAAADVKPGGSAALYDTGTLRTIFIRFDNDDWERELEAFYRTDVDVPATVSVDGVEYRDVGVHFRGNSSYMMVPAGSKRSMNLAFDFVTPAQRLLGHRTLNLLNANGDPTFLRPVLYAQIANEFIPAPKANFVRAVINGESWGIYVNAEQFNSDFTRERFGSAGGTRWKVPGVPFGRGGLQYLGDHAEPYRAIYQIKTRDDAKAWASLARVCKTLAETSPDQLEAALAPMLDVDSVLRFLALEVALVNSDGYWTRASDYSLYLDPAGRFHVIPQDMNEGLADESAGRRGMPPPPDGSPRDGGPFGFFGPGGPRGRGPGGGALASVTLDPLVGLDDAAKPLRSKLLAVPALRARYLAYVRHIADRWLDWRVLDPLVTRHTSLIAADVEADTRKLFTSEAFRNGLRDGADSLRGFADARRAFLLNATR